MPSVNHEQAREVLLRILPNMDSGQIEEVKSLTGKTYVDRWRVMDLTNISEYFWTAKKDGFEFLAGVQNIGWDSQNVWILSTNGIKKNLRFFLRELKLARKYIIESLEHEPQNMYATMPIWFEDGHKLAEHFGFSIKDKSQTTVTYQGVLI